MLNLNATLFAQVVQQARADVANQPDAAKWNAAIDRAIELAETNPWIERAEHGIIVAGSEGAYTANGQCQCRAYEKGLTHCKHRVLAKLVKRHDQAQARQTPAYAQALAEALELFA